MMTTEIEQYRGYTVRWTGWKGRFGQLIARRLSPHNAQGDHLELSIAGDHLRYLPQMRSLIDKWAS